MDSKTKNKTYSSRSSVSGPNISVRTSRKRDQARASYKLSIIILEPKVYQSKSDFLRSPVRRIQQNRPKGHLVLLFKRKKRTNKQTDWYFGRTSFEKTKNCLLLRRGNQSDIMTQDIFGQPKLGFPYLSLPKLEYINPIA